MPDITFKGISSSTYKLIITIPPQVTHAEIVSGEMQIPGKDGKLYSVNPYKADAMISVTFALVDNNFQTTMRNIRKWLSGTGALRIGDVNDSYYEVKKVFISTDDRVIKRYGIMKVDFTVYPYEFLDSGDTAITSFPITNNADVALPLYKISGSGSGVLTVNGKTMNYTVDGNLYIDTRRLIAYKLDNGSKLNRSDKISGDYDNLILTSGSNTISATVGTLEVYPKWGYGL